MKKRTVRAITIMLAVTPLVLSLMISIWSSTTPHDLTFTVLKVFNENEGEWLIVCDRSTIPWFSAQKYQPFYMRGNVSLPIVPGRTYHITFTQVLRVGFSLYLVSSMEEIH